MRLIHTTLFYVLLSIFIIGWIAVFFGMISGCGNGNAACELPTGTYTRTYTQETATGACTEYENEPQFQQSFIQGKPIVDDAECTASMDTLSDSQCDLRLTWQCESVADNGTRVSVEWTEIVSQHGGGERMEGARAIVLDAGNQTCESMGHVTYEAQL